MLIYILFVIGFFILIKGADLMVDGASSIAYRYRISPIVIGLTIVAFGTSAPEFAVNIFASAQGNAEIAIGNVLGSNLANTLLILGTAAVIYPLVTKNNTVWKEIPFSLLAIIILAVLANDVLIDGMSSSLLTRGDGLILLCFFTIFLFYSFGISKITDGDDAIEIKEMSLSKALLFIVLGLLGLVYGGKWIVDGAVHIARLFNVSEALIGVTIVAIGTSLPELATSAMAAYRKQTDIAIGNVIGSNIFNIFWILGASSLIKPIPFNEKSGFDIGMNIFASALLFAILFIGKKHTIQKWQGFLLLAIYIGYIVYSIYRQ